MTRCVSRVNVTSSSSFFWHNVHVMIMYYYYFVLNDYCTLLYTISTVRMVYNLLTTYNYTYYTYNLCTGGNHYEYIHRMSCAFMYCMVVVIVWTLLLYYIYIILMHWNTSKSVLYVCYKIIELFNCYHMKNILYADTY